MHYLVTLVGFLLMAGTAGSSDYYEECRAAADCVAGDPMSMTQMVIQLVVGLLLFAWGILGLNKKGQG